MKINIKAHLDAEKKKHEELVAKAKSEKEKLLKDIALKEEAKAQLEKEKKKKEGLLRDSEAEGLDVTKLKDKIRELESQKVQTARDIEALKKAEQQSEEVVQRSFDEEDLMTSVLKNQYRCEEAVVVDGMDEVFKLLPVEVTQLDSAGRPKQCTISIAQQQQVVLNVKPTENHFWKNFRPATLRWLPAAEEEESDQAWQHHYNDAQTLHRHPKGTSERVRVFLDSKSNKFVISQKLGWHCVEKQQNYPYKEETIYFEDDFEDVAIQLGAKLKNLVEAEGGELDLEKSYRDNPFLAHARSEVASLTSSKPLFKESSEVLTSVEVYKTIKDEWDAFVNCPWSGQISSTLALLKYHVENGERVRFWSGDFENNYGLRLRTRDHDWIVGQLFIEKSRKAATAKAMMQIHGCKDDWVVASLGRLFISVSRDRSERQRH